MKKSFLMCLFAALCTVVSFTACSSDDDDDNTVAVSVDDIAGTYDGTLSVLGSTIDEEIKIEKINDTKVKVRLEDFSFSGMPIGDIAAECSATPDNNKILINGNAIVTVAMLGNAELPVTVNGNATDKELDLTINITDIPAIGTISVNFNGTK